MNLCNAPSAPSRRPASLANAAVKCSDGMFVMSPPLMASINQRNSTAREMSRSRNRA